MQKLLQSEHFPVKTQRNDSTMPKHRVISFLIKKRRARFHRESSYGRFYIIQ